MCPGQDQLLLLLKLPKLHVMHLMLLSAPAACCQHPAARLLQPKHLPAQHLSASQHFVAAAGWHT
jgi:hypothetical protein